MKYTKDVRIIKEAVKDVKAELSSEYLYKRLMKEMIDEIPLTELLKIFSFEETSDAKVLIVSGTINIK